MAVIFIPFYQELLKSYFLAKKEKNILKRYATLHERVTTDINNYMVNVTIFLLRLFTVITIL